jgi:AraC-like DNA-binding protein
LPPHFLQQERIYATTSELFALWAAIGEVSKDPGIGLSLGAEPRFERYDATQIAAVCSKTFRDALQRIARCKVLTCPEEIRLHARGNEATVEFAFLNDEGAEPGLLVDVCLSWVVAIGQRGTDGQIRPLRVELARPAQHQALLEAHFACPVRFKSKRNTVAFRNADLDLPFTTFNEELLRILGAQLDSELEERRSASSITEQVMQVLRRSLAGRRPSREDAAQVLHLSVRTLQRRLNDAGTTFQQVVRDARRELARKYLADKRVEFSEAAFLLGYDDTNSFFRAFQTWEGTSPGEWRMRHGVRSRNPGAVNSPMARPLYQRERHEHDMDAHRLPRHRHSHDGLRWALLGHVACSGSQQFTSSTSPHHA